MEIPGLLVVLPDDAERNRDGQADCTGGQNDEALGYFHRIKDAEGSAASRAEPLI